MNPFLQPKSNKRNVELNKKSKTGISTLIAIIGMIVLLVVGFVAGYYLNTSQPSNSQNNPYPEDSAWRTASIKLSGSTTVLPIGNASAIDFMNRYNTTTVTVIGGGTGVGYSNIIDKQVDIGMASREPKQTEIDNAKNNSVALWLYPIALDAVCVVVNPSVANSSYPLNLTLQEVGKIYAGTYTYWDEVKPGLPHKEVFIVVREPGSGTRGTFEEFTMTPWKYNLTTNINTRMSNPDVRSTVESTPYSIGYVGFGFLTTNMYTLAIAKDGASPYLLPTTSTILTRSYPMSRYLYFVTGSRPAAGSLADRFISFVLSPVGQQIVESQGFLKLPETP
jgi:phosphate transport system substrate-binding protein